MEAELFQRRINGLQAGKSSFQAWKCVSFGYSLLALVLLLTKWHEVSTDLGLLLGVGRLLSHQDEAQATPDANSTGGQPLTWPPVPLDVFLTSHASQFVPLAANNQTEPNSSTENEDEANPVAQIGAPPVSFGLESLASNSSQLMAHMHMRLNQELGGNQLLRREVDSFVAEFRNAKSTLSLSTLLVLVYIISWLLMTLAINDTRISNDVSLRNMVLLSVFGTIDMAASLGFVMLRLIMFNVKNNAFVSMILSSAALKDLPVRLSTDQLTAFTALRLIAMRSCSAQVDIYVSVVVALLTILRLYAIVRALAYYRRLRRFNEMAHHFLWPPHDRQPVAAGTLTTGHAPSQLFLEPAGLKSSVWHPKQQQQQHNQQQSHSSQHQLGRSSVERQFGSRQSIDQSNFFAIQTDPMISSEQLDQQNQGQQQLILAPGGATLNPSEHYRLAPVLASPMLHSGQVSYLRSAAGTAGPADGQQASDLILSAAKFATHQPVSQQQRQRMRRHHYAHKLQGSSSKRRPMGELSSQADHRPHTNHFNHLNQQQQQQQQHSQQSLLIIPTDQQHDQRHSTQVKRRLNAPGAAAAAQFASGAGGVELQVRGADESATMQSKAAAAAAAPATRISSSAQSETDSETSSSSLTSGEYNLADGRRQLEATKSGSVRVDELLVRNLLLGATLESNVAAAAMRPHVAPGEPTKRRRRSEESETQAKAKEERRRADVLAELLAATQPLDSSAVAPMDQKQHSSGEVAPATRGVDSAASSSGASSGDANAAGARDLQLEVERRRTLEHQINQTAAAYNLAKYYFG